MPELLQRQLAWDELVGDSGESSGPTEEQKYREDQTDSYRLYLLLFFLVTTLALRVRSVDQVRRVAPVQWTIHSQCLSGKLPGPFYYLGDVTLSLTPGSGPPWL